MTMDRPTCATCAAFARYTEKSTEGSCRRRAPTIYHDDYIFPEVEDRLWCLEHVTAQRTTQGPKPETQAAPEPSPEPDPQGL